MACLGERIVTDYVPTVTVTPCGCDPVVFTGIEAETVYDGRFMFGDSVHSAFDAATGTAISLKDCCISYSAFGATPTDRTLPACTCCLCDCVEGEKKAEEKAVEEKVAVAKK